MQKSKFRKPYKEDGKANFPEIKNKSGVYIIKYQGKIVYVGHSQYDLYKTMYRHFQSWNHKYQKVISYPVNQRKYFSVRVILCTGAQALRLEKALVIRYKPKDNDLKYEQYTLDWRDKKIESEYFSENVDDDLPF